MKQLQALNHYFIRYKSYLLWGIIFVILSNLLGVYPPILIGKAIDMVKDKIIYHSLIEGFTIQKHHYQLFTHTIFIFGCIIIVLALLKGLCMYLMRQMLIVMSRKIEFDLRNDIFLQYERLSTDFYKKNRTGDMMARITEDVGKVRMYLGPAIMYALNTVTLFIMIIGTMLHTHFWLTVIVLLPLPLLSLGIYYLNMKISRKSEVLQNQLSQLTNFVQESFSGIKVLQAFAREKMTADRFKKESEIYKAMSNQLAVFNGLYFPLMIFFIGLSTLLVIYLGALESTKGYFTSGLIAQFIIYVGMLTWPVTSIGWVASMVQRAEASQKRINEFLLLQPSIQNPTQNPFVLKGEISLQDVSFTYPDTGVVALKNLSFSLQQNEIIAIVGKTGSGKSTIADLLLRKYDPDSGEIRIDGNNLREINLNQYRKHIGYVPQDGFLFSDTILENICFGLEKRVAEDEAREIANEVAVLQEIERFPAGFDTLIGERGITLSGGQKQRISLARALIKKPQLLLLDDCFSAVDADTEKRILSHLQAYLKGRYAIIITSRLLTTLHFDRIIVMQEGRIAEQGSETELLRRGGLYADIWERQRRSHNSEAFNY